MAANKSTFDLIATWPVEEQLALMHSISGRLLGHGLAVAAIGAVKTKSKVAKTADPDAPKREGSWWIKATQHVREHLSDLIAADKAAGVAVKGTAPITVSSMLKDAGELSQELLPTKEQVVAMYEKYKEDPPAPKSSASTASGGSAAGSAKSKHSELSEEEKKARRSEAAKKAAATRKANKEAAAALAAGGGGAAGGAGPVAPKNTGEETEDGREIWTIGGKRYAKVETALWDAETLAWAGELQEDGSIDATAAEPELEMADE